VGESSLILLGSISIIFGCVYSYYLAIILGAAIALLGIILSFVRESRYIDAANEVENLKKKQREMKKSIRLLTGKVELLNSDIKEMQEKLKKLQNMKMVEYYSDGKSTYFVQGKSGPAFSENNTDN
jgi:uncharacterized membrane protein YgaE (UPF0421/DUF939 family)